MSFDESTRHAPTQSQIRWRSALAIVGIVAATVLVAAAEPEFLGGMTQIVGMSALGAGAIGLCIWFAFFSGLDERTRARGSAAIGLGCALVVCLVRLEGFRGQMFPILAWRWSPTADERFAAARARAPHVASNPIVDNDDIDLTRTTPNDFPGFLGPKRLGVVQGVSLARDWSARPPRELWRREVGLGWSSFAIVDRYAVTQEQRGEREAVVCYELLTGKERWVHSDKARFSEVLGGDGPRATPTVERGRVYALGATGILNCLEGSTGKVVWWHNILEENGALNIDWGMAGSPLLVEGLVIVCPGGPEEHAVVAYDAETGQRVWNCGSDRSTYVSPQFTQLDGVPQVLTVSAQTTQEQDPTRGSALESRDPASGKLLWRYDWAITQNIKCAQPTTLGDFGETKRANQVLVSSGYTVGSILLKIRRAGDEWQVEKVWQSQQLRSKFSSLVIRAGHAFGLDEGILTCLDLNDGRRRWKQGRYGYGQLLLVGDLLLIQAESGDVVLVEANTEEHRGLGRFTAFTSKTWNPPALSGRILLVRNDREAACYELPLADDK